MSELHCEIRTKHTIDDIQFPKLIRLLCLTLPTCLYLPLLAAFTCLHSPTSLFFLSSVEFTYLVPSTGLAGDTWYVLLFLHLRLDSHALAHHFTLPHHLTLPRRCLSSMHIHAQALLLSIFYILSALPLPLPRPRPHNLSYFGRQLRPNFSGPLFQHSKL